MCGGESASANKIQQFVEIKSIQNDLLDGMFRASTKSQLLLLSAAYKCMTVDVKIDFDLTLFNDS